MEDRSKSKIFNYIFAEKLRKNFKTKIGIITSNIYLLSNLKRIHFDNLYAGFHKFNFILKDIFYVS